jgi:hypothetical protein
VLKEFNFAGTEKDLPGFVKGMGAEILKNVTKYLEMI